MQTNLLQFHTFAANFIWQGFHRITCNDLGTMTKIADSMILNVNNMEMMLLPIVVQLVNMKD